MTRRAFHHARTSQAPDGLGRIELTPFSDFSVEFGICLGLLFVLIVAHVLSSVGHFFDLTFYLALSAKLKPEALTGSTEQKAISTQSHREHSASLSEFG